MSGLTPMDILRVECEAREELRKEDLRVRVDALKERLRAAKGRPWWKRLFPYHITIHKDPT